MDEDRVTYFAETDYRSNKAKFGIKAKDRSRHVYVIGKTGMGKSTLLENMAIQDIQNGEGMAFIDPHGGTAEKLLDYVPEDRVKDVVYFAPFDIDFPISFNVMEDVGADKRHLVASGLMSSFKKIWVDAWSARMEYILNNILLALLEYPNSTLLGVNRMLADKEYRKQVVENISDPSVRSFWVDEFAKYGDRYMQEAGAAIQNKIGQFTANPIIRNIIGQPKSSFDIRRVMDEKKILIMNLSKGRVGEQNAALLGGMLITKIYLGAMSRADASASDLVRLPHFYFYVDEFQSFASDSFADILSEARKYKLNLTIAHQYVEQMSEEVRAAVFGNVGTMIVFRVGSFDAQIFEKEFSPQFLSDDIVNLGQYQMYLRLMIDGVGSKPFSARALPPIVAPPHSNREGIIENSRQTNARPRQVTEEEIKKWHAPILSERQVERLKQFGDRPAESAPVREPAPMAPKPYSPAPASHPSPGQSGPAYQPRPVRPVSSTTPVPAPLKENPTPRPPSQSSPSQIPVSRPPAPVSKADIPPIILAEKPEAVVKPFAQGATRSSLKDILKKLESEESKEENTPITASPALNPLPEKKAQSVPLTRLSHNDRSASPNKLSELKSVLEKLNKDAESKKSVARPDISTDEMPATPPQKSETKNPDLSAKKPKEVPEDILKKILE